MMIEVLDPSRILARSTQLIPDILAKALELPTAHVGIRPTAEGRKEALEGKTAQKKQKHETPVAPIVTAQDVSHNRVDASNGVATENETSSKSKAAAATVEESDGVQCKALSGGDGVSNDAEGSVSSKGKKRRESSSGTTAMKRPRLVWTPELHRRFVEAVQQLGLKNAVPKSIMQLMNVEGLSRENVASHLQKYRMYLKRTADATRGSCESDALHVKPTPLPISTLEQQNFMSLMRGDHTTAVPWPNFTGVINNLSIPELQNMLMQGNAQNLVPSGIPQMVNFGGNFFPMNTFGFPPFVMPPVSSTQAKMGSNSTNHGSNSG